MIDELYVLSRYWQPGREERTAAGVLMAGAKDGGDPEALSRLCSLVRQLAVPLPLPPRAVVMWVPPAPDRPDHVVPALAAALAEARGLAAVPALTLEHSRPRLRDTLPDGRPDAVAGAGYRVEGDVAGKAVVLVDDVFLTGATVGHLAELLVDAGAARVDAVVVCRTRRAG